MPITTSPLLWYFFENSSNQGISILHGAHHVAQKFSNTTLPLYAVRLMGLPPASLRTKEGAGWPAGSGAACALLNDKTHKQRAMTYFNFICKRSSYQSYRRIISQPSRATQLC